MGQIMQSPYVLIGTSDDDAHVLFGVNVSNDLASLVNQILADEMQKAS
jgi:hypothetical protein